MKVTRNVPHELRRCDNCGRSPAYLAEFTKIQRPTDASIYVCAECLSEAERGVRDALREDYGKRPGTPGQ